MTITISADLNRKGDKKWYTFEWGKASGQRRAIGIRVVVLGYGKKRVEKSAEDRIQGGS